MLATRLGNGYRQAKSRHLFRDVVDSSASVLIDDAVITERSRLGKPRSLRLIAKELERGGVRSANRAPLVAALLRYGFAS